METAWYLEILEHEGRSLADAAEQAGPGAHVPACPGWRVRDLLRHTGVVHRWAAGFVADACPTPRPMEEHPDLDGTELLAWYRAGHRALLDTLREAKPDVECWTFLPGAESGLSFWARRQAHETAVHRWDAQAARGGDPTRVATDFAVDGVDELLRGFHARRKSRVRTPEPRVLRIRATDADAVWTVRLSQEPPVTARDAAGDAECEVSGPAAELYLSLWNRLPVPEVTGDHALAELWRETSAVV
ncbi:maleylpyruvate isomerase family mycothiol-dependent enzyme [Streptomyces sp. I4(2020)]|uniref:maleylpyruvate isomerase family mycothiol-dependent enzyme n=1 Tax=Streptomyces sp. I4(2020) TaxID=2760981 RepID=UPI0018EE88A0|nr:maleylpyruvate isomerase family mycothiol-dependent enzyme [Streptomyces sp. I4(2020)]MBJ6612376.1 maleylpyruvate isomerase family mycothiol-dependent enzyme [Streptomyces sp. I3(2020)]MBJ6627382.1 maleylpyruvate isomerase family mycothiol-dependent enzyme [Streptomyces sp. I4(2020)]